MLCRPDETATVVIELVNLPWESSNVNNCLKELSAPNSDMGIDCSLFLPSQKVYDDRAIYFRLWETL